MAFFDYNMVITESGLEKHHLCLNGKPLWHSINGSFCTVERSDTGHAYRTTQWRGMKGNRRYHWHDSVDEALTAGIKWASRRFNEDLRRGR